MRPGRLLPFFSVAFILVYAACVYFNLALFTYLPAAPEHHFAWLVPRPMPPMPMFWYGWLSTSLILSTCLTGLAAVVLRGERRSVWPWLAWGSPVAAILVVAFALRQWFLM